ncbi:MAG: hypothetical protein ACFCUG_11430 [Thiotrichales bacterium]
MPSVRIDLVIPGVFDRWSEWRGDYTGLPDFARVAGWWGRGKGAAIAAVGYEATLWSLLRAPLAGGEELSVARALSGMNGATICRADPAYLRAGVSDLIAYGLGSAPLDAAERQACADRVNAQLGARGSFRLDAAGGGYLALPDPLALRTVPPSQAWGRSVRRHLPEAVVGGRSLLALLNEIQMALHGADFNRAREQRGAPPANTLWLWGCGTHPAPAQHDYTTIIADDGLVAGLAEGATIPLADWLARPNLPGGHLLLVWDALLTPIWNDDLNQWLETMRIFETRWLPLLRRLLGRGACGELRILPCNGAVFRLGRWDRWLRWRAPTTLAALSQPE